MAGAHADRSRAIDRNLDDSTWSEANDRVPIAGHAIVRCGVAWLLHAVPSLIV